MLIDPPFVIPASNLSLAWGHAFCRVVEPPGSQRETPILVSIGDFDDIGEPVEVPEIRAVLDRMIASLNQMGGRPRVFPVEATAQTIFPRMLWSPYSPCPADQLFDRYIERTLPKLKKRCPLNSRGTYFSRMICATGLDSHNEKKTQNQLKDIIRWYGANEHLRNSAMQVSVIDPAKDLTGSARQGFPCLQQVSFARHDMDLVVGAYYPTENIFERGYGNYLGLCRLGCFMAHELNLRLARVNIFVLQPRLDVNRGDLADLVRELRNQLSAHATRKAIQQ